VFCLLEGDWHRKQCISVWLIEADGQQVTARLQPVGYRGFVGCELAPASRANHQNLVGRKFSTGVITYGKARGLQMAFAGGFSGVNGSSSRRPLPIRDVLENVSVSVSATGSLSVRPVTSSFEKRAGVSAELHVYANTTHDFGVRTNNHPHSQWTARCAEWLNDGGFIQSDKKN